MRQGWAFATAVILLFVLIIQPMGSSHFAKGEKTCNNESEWPNKDMEFYRDLHMNYSSENPRMGFRSGMMPPFFNFSALEISFFKGMIREQMDLKSKDWNISFKPVDRSIRYMTEIILNKTGAPGMNRTILDLDFKPTFSDEGRKIFYNLTIRENLTMDQVVIKWRFDIDRNSVEDKLKRNISDWDWNHKTDWSALDSKEGKEMERMNWNKMARFNNRSGDTYYPVRSSQIVEEEDLVLEISMDIGSEVEVVESGGYLEFLDPLFEILGTDPDEVQELLQDHLISFLIGAAIFSSLVVVVLPVMIKKSATSDPLKDLDYRQSRFYKKD